MIDKELYRTLGDDYSPPCSNITYDADRQATLKRILERRFPEQIPKTPIIMQTCEAETLNLIDLLNTELILYNF